MFYTFKPCNIKPKTMVKCAQTGNCKRPPQKAGHNNFKDKPYLYEV